MSTQLDDSFNSTDEESERIISLLTVLLKTHYSQKSQVGEIEKLFKLDKLSELRELDKLKSLDKMEHLVELQNLEQLKSLTLLERLDSLKRLEDLNKLEALNKMENLSELRSLDKLSAISTLNSLLDNHKNVLLPLEKLSHLEKLSELEKLSSLAKLDNLSDLQKLEQLERLTNLSLLSQLESLSHLDSMKNLEALEQLNSLQDLGQLTQLGALSNLKELKNLDQLKKLDSLEKIDDIRFAERLSKLDKLDILKQNTKSMVIQQIIGTGLEFLKLAVAGALMIFLLSRETGREIAVKALPAIGFGSGAQVNLGLRLLMSESTPEDFQELIKNVRVRAFSELASAFSIEESLPLQKRIDLLSLALSYSYTGAGVDLSKEVRTEYDKKLAIINESAIDTISYELARAEGANDEKEIAYLREVKILLIQKQYPQVLEKTLPFWNKSRGINMAIVTATASIRLLDPKTLDEVVRNNLPGHGKK